MKKAKEELNKIYACNLLNPIPIEDINKITKEFEHVFDSECFIYNFENHCAGIAGTISFVLNDKVDSLSNYHKEIIKKNFFKKNPQYSIIKDNISNYPAFQNEYNVYEYARILLLTIIK